MDLRGVAMVTRAGTVRAELAGGLADAAAGVPCTAQTRFQICSISKQFAAAAALLLAEAGRLALDDPVDRWLPGGPPQWSGVTLHHLLSHTAGVPHWLEAPFDLAAMAGTGDIWSTAADLTSFTAALHAGNLITNESLHAMLTPHAPIEDDDETLITTGYGYGVFTGTSAGHAVFYHPGDNPGYLTFSGWVPDRAAGLVILANDESARIPDLLRQLLPTALEP